MHGREAKLPIESLFCCGETKTEEVPDGKITELLELQESVHAEVKENIAKAQQRQKRQYDAKHNTQTTLKVLGYAFSKHTKHGV
jgi:hypothetical protein